MWQTKSIPGARLQDDKNKNPLMNMDLKNDKKCINNYWHACLPQENLEESMMLFLKKTLLYLLMVSLRCFGGLDLDFV